MSEPATTGDRQFRGVSDWWQRQGVDEETTVTIYVRSYVPPPAGHEIRRRLLNTLSFAENRGRIAEQEFQVIGDELCLCEDCRPTYGNTGLLRTVARLCAWTDGELDSQGFQTRTVRNAMTGERHRTLVPPETTVAVARKGTLVGVFPCEVAGETYDLEAFLADLQAAVTGKEKPSDDTESEHTIAGIDS